jgi:hypothetical protein
MRISRKRLSIVFAGGVLGGLANALAIYIFGAMGITAAMGVSIAGDLAPPTLYWRSIWGGIWGALFLLPFMHGSIWKRGTLYSLGPTLVQLFVVFPLVKDKGICGLELGALTPLMVFVFNAVWGLVAAWWVVGAADKGIDIGPA